MDNRARRAALVFLPLCSGLGLLALAVGQFITDSPVPLPPPFFSTQPNQPPLLIVSNLTSLADAPVITIAALPYRHPSGAFSVYYPDSWQIDEAEDSAQFTAPDNTGQFSITFVPGEAVPNGDYERDLRQAWGDTSTFSITATETVALPEAWSAAFTFQQTFLPEPGTVPMQGYAAYRQREALIYIVMIEVQASARDPLMSILKTAVENLETHPEAAFDDSE